MDELLLLDTLEESEILETLLVLLGDDESEEEDHTPKRVVMSVDINFWRTLEDLTFHDYFRMSKSVFEKLIVCLGKHLTAKRRIKFLRTPLDVALMMTAFIMATPDSFRTVGNQFGVCKSVVHFNYKYIIKGLREMAAQWIQWPTAGERDLITMRMENQYGYPGVVGCIDCCHIKINAPHVNQQNYVNRHHDYSIVIQAVSDDKLLYRDYYVGETGSVGDIRTFYRSPLARNLFAGQDHLSEGEHLLGDGAYPLSPQIMIPFVNDGRLSRRQRAHNLQLSGGRSCVERSFCLLRGKWRRLKHLPCFSHKIVINHIVASMVLHNFLILGGEIPATYAVIDPLHPPQGPAPAVADVHELCLQSRGDGAIKREYIAEFLHPADN